MGEKQMHVILHAADDERLAVEVPEDAAEVAVEFVAEGFIPEEWPPFLGREDRVQKNLCERLRHGGRMKIRAAGFNPFRVDACLWMRSQDSPKRATLGWMIQSLWDWMARSCRASDGAIRLGLDGVIPLRLDGAIPLRLESHGLSESQRDSILQPRVARHELPWGTNRHRASTLQELNRTGKHAVNTPRLKNLPQLRLLKVIRKKQLLLLRNRLFGNRRKLRRIRGEGGGGDETGEGEEAGVHGGDEVGS